MDIGVEDVLVANQIVDKRKIARVAQLDGGCRISICVDRLLITARGTGR